MVGILKVSPLLRAIGVIGAVAALVTGITFAALQSQATLTNNTISTASADLLLWDGDSFEETAPGFNVTNLLPGTPSAPQEFYFKNNGTATLNVTARIPVAPAVTNIGDFGEVDVTLDCQGVGNDPVATTMAALIAGEVALDTTLVGGAQGVIGETENPANCTAVFNIDPITVSGESANIGSFDIRFTGNQVIGS
jgi:hypothetical protein